jgi:hypothetical protein
MTDKGKLNQDEKTIQALYSRLEKIEPPSELDLLILNTAHDDLDKKENIIDIKSRKRSWYVPLSSVAILVISLSVVIDIALSPDLTMDKSEPVKVNNEQINHLRSEGQSLEYTDSLMEKDAASLSGKRVLNVETIREEKTRRVSREDKSELQRKQQLLQEHKVQEKQKIRSFKKTKPMPGVGYMPEAGLPRSLSMPVEKEASIADSAEISAKEGNSVEEWVQRLQDLYRQGHKTEFNRVLKEFRVNYPEYVLPDQLDKWERELRK